MRFKKVEYVRDAAKLFINKVQLYVDLEGAFVLIQSDYGFILSIKEGATIYKEDK